MVEQSATRILAKYVCGLSFKDLPREITDRAKNLIMDVLASAMAGQDKPFPRVAFEVVKANKGKSTVFGFGQKVPAGDAAFVNSIMISSIGQDDIMYHFQPGQVVISTALAIAEEQGSTGQDVIAAVVAGYDVVARIFLGGTNIVPRFRGTPMFGTFSAAAVAGKLLKLNEDQMVSALGYAANLASGLCECWNAGTPEAKYHGGVASRNGILAASLARAGAIAAETTLEGKAGFYTAYAGTIDGIKSATSDLGKKFYILNATYKPYPVCAANQVPVGLAVDMVKKYSIKGSEIEQVNELIPNSSYFYPGVNYAGPFGSRFQAIMSNQFTTAAAFLGRPVAQISYYDENYGDAEVAQLAKKVKLTGEKDGPTVRFDVILKNGKKYSLEGDSGELAPSKVLEPTTERIVEKFEALVVPVLGKEKTGRIRDIVLKLDSLDNIRSLTRELA